jgi:hypothetical protein
VGDPRRPLAINYFEGDRTNYFGVALGAVGDDGEPADDDVAHVGLMQAGEQLCGIESGRQAGGVAAAFPKSR